MPLPCAPTIHERLTAVPADEGLLRRLGGGLAHHVNNALTGVIGYLELALRQTPADSPTLPHLHASLTCAHRAADTVRRIMAYACRAEAPGRLVPLSLSRLAREVVARAPAVGVTITVAEGPEALVRASPTLLGRALEAIVENAIEASPVGGSVTVSIEEHADLCCLHVRDRGEGLSLEGQTRLFEPFWTTKMGTHLGLGLVMAREVVQAQGGALTVMPAVNGGVLACISLPALEGATVRCVEPAHPLAAPHLPVSATPHLQSV
jgi:signal transduction histidine kinase